MRVFTRILGIVFVVTVTVVGVIFAMANRDPIDLVFLRYVSVDLPIFAWLFISFGIGLLVGIFCMLPRYLITRGRLKRALSDETRTKSDELTPPLIAPNKDPYDGDL